MRQCSNEDLVFQLNLIAPTQLGIDSWQIGDYARYRRQGKRSESNESNDKFQEEVSFHVVGELEKSGSHGYWLKKTGFHITQPDLPTDIYRWVTVQDLRITSKNIGFEDPLNYLPLRIDICEQTDIPLANLIKLGKEAIETEVGTFECVHYRVELGENGESLEIWSSAAIPPLGIVRLRSQTDVLELISFGKDTDITVPRLIQPLLEGISTLAYGCNSCHGYDNCHEMFFPPR